MTRLHPLATYPLFSILSVLVTDTLLAHTPLVLALTALPQTTFLASHTQALYSNQLHRESCSTSSFPLLL